MCGCSSWQLASLVLLLTQLSLEALLLLPMRPHLSQVPAAAAAKRPSKHSRVTRHLLQLLLRQSQPVMAMSLTHRCCQLTCLIFWTATAAQQARGG
jgi:hypothetical protein